MCSYAKENNIQFIFLSKFLCQIKTTNFIAVSNIFDLNQTNKYLLLNYNIMLIDSTNFIFNLIDIKIIIKSNLTISIPEIYYKQWTSINKFNIDTSINFNDFLPTISSPIALKIYFSINGQQFDREYKINPTTGFLYNSILFDFDMNISKFAMSYRYNDSSVIFYNILRNLIFNKQLTDKATTLLIQGLQGLTNMQNKYSFNKNIFSTNKYIYPVSLDTPIHGIHLRLENDAMEHWGLQNKMNIIDYKILVENKYIELIQKYFGLPHHHNELIIILAADYDNRVIEYLIQNNYCIFMPPKIEINRDINAIIDLHIGQYINNILIGVFETTYSYLFIYNIYFFILKID